MNCRNCGLPIMGDYYEFSCTSCGRANFCSRCYSKYSSRLDTTRQPVTCPLCNRGQLRWRRVSSGGGGGGRCPVCGGTGRWVKDPHYPPVKCERCGGTGYV